MKKKVILIYLILSMFIVPNIFGQRFREDRDFSDRREQMENMRIWKMTEFLELESDQAEKFFPKLRVFEKMIREKQEKQFQLMQEINKKVKDLDFTPSENEVEKYIKNISKIEKEIIDEKEKFIKQVSDILSPAQQMKYIVFEMRFRNRLMRMLDNKPDGPMPPQFDRRKQ